MGKKDRKGKVRVIIDAYNDISDDWWDKKDIPEGAEIIDMCGVKGYFLIGYGDKTFIPFMLPDRVDKPAERMGRIFHAPYATLKALAHGDIWEKVAPFAPVLALGICFIITALLFG